MDKSLELYHEEQRKIALDIKSQNDTVIDLLTKLYTAYAPPIDNVIVTGKVEVNTEKEVAVTNLDELKTAVTELREALQLAIAKNKPVDTVTVKNIDVAQSKSVAVNNVSELVKALEPLFKAIDTKPVVNVTKEQIQLPTTAKQAIAVRLSDGKSFYNAIAQAVSAATGPEDPLAGYQITDQDESTATKYYGYTKRQGQWYIMRSSNGAYRYAKGEPQHNGGGLYVDAWNNRSNLDYDYYYEVF